MFEPENYITNNPELFKSIQERANGNITQPLFYLMSDSPRLTREMILGFPYIPAQIKYNYGANYNRVSRSMTNTEDLQFTGNKAEEITVDNVILSTRGNKRSYLPLINLLKELMTNQFEPSFFYIGIQERVLYPYVLTDLSHVETGWIEGEPVEGEVSMKFVKSPWGLNTDNIQTDYFYEQNKDKRTAEDIDENAPSSVKQNRERIEELLQ